MEYKKSKLIRNAIFAFVIIAAATLILMSQSDLKGIFDVIKTVDYRYLLAAFGVLVAYFILNLVGIYILAKHRKVKIKTRDLFLIGGTEPFFNGITPFATGGQPFQVYALHRKGVSLDDGTAILVMNFITFMISTNIFAIASLVYYEQFVSKIPNFTWIVIMGFVINFSVLVLMFSLALSKKLRNGCCHAIDWLAHKKMFAKMLNGKQEVFNNYFDGMQAGCMELLHKPSVLIGCIGSKLASLVFYYAIPFFVLKAVSAPVTISNLLYIILGTSFAVTMVVWVPTPGGTGGMELAFFSIFLTIEGMNQSLAASSMALWRLYTYYFLMIVGFVFYIILEVLDSKERKARDLALRAAPYIERDARELEEQAGISVETPTINETEETPKAEEIPQEKPKEVDSND